MSSTDVKETTLKSTYCRICEAHCGLKVSIQDDKIIAVKPDKSHPVSKGYACIKGTSLGEIHHDPDRVNFPLKRVEGKFEKITWTQAYKEIGQRVKKIQRHFGKRSIAMYQGNPSFFSFQNFLYSHAFLEALGSPNLYASHSIDANNKLEVATHLYGRSMVHPVPDLDHTEFFMCMGSNPSVSQMSFFHVINPIEKFKKIEARGGKVLFVDPRKHETAKKVGEHLFINPGTDVYFLLSILYVIQYEECLDTRKVAKNVSGIEEFLTIAKDWRPEQVEDITGVNANMIRRVAKAYLRAKSASIYMSTGLNMGPFSSLCYWLVQGLNLITGNVDKQGGLLVPKGAFDVLKLAELIGLGGFDEHRTLVNHWHRVAGAFPASALAEEIETDHPERIRALFISAGNPVHSIPNGQALSEAMKDLDLVVTVDMYITDSNQQADYILPATDMLERSDYPVSHMVLQNTPHAQYTDKMITPKFERKPEWEIYSELSMACGGAMLGKSVCHAVPRINRFMDKIPFLNRYTKNLQVTPDTLISTLLNWGGHTTLEHLKEQTQGLLLAPNQAGSFLGQRVPTKDGKVHLWSATLAKDLKRLEQHFSDYQGKSDETLLLIGQRDRRTHNSWMHNNRKIKKPDSNAALLHPDDAKTRNITESDSISISLKENAISVPVHITEDIMPGVIAVPHGWGHQGTGMNHAASLNGANVNQIIAGGKEYMDPSGQAIILAQEVIVELASTGKLPELTLSTSRKTNRKNLADTGEA